MDVVTSDRLSHLVETVYGCVIEPDRWPTTMEEICSDLGCFMSAIFLVDLEHSQHFFFREWNTDPRWQARFPRYHKDMTMLYRHHALPRYNEDMTMLHRRAPSPSTHAIDEPLVLSRHVPEQIWHSTRYYQEWARPQGFCDAIEAIVLRNASQIVVFSAVRHQSKGVATDREISLLR